MITHAPRNETSAAVAPGRRGFSLLEIMIALSLFMMLMTAAMEMLSSANSYADLDNINKQMEFAGKKAMDVIGRDMCNSAWFPTPAAVSPITNLYTFPRVWKSNDPARLNAPSPSDKWTSKWGDMLTFYRLRTEATIAGTTDDPSQLVVEHVNFNDTSPGARPIAMDQYWNARGVTSLMLNDTWTDGQPIVGVIWESSSALAQPTAGGAGTPGTNWNDNKDPTKLRVYRYVVIPNTTNPLLGTLVRQWNNGGWPSDGSGPGDAEDPTGATGWPDPTPNNSTTMVDNVCKVSFDTYLTEPDTATAGVNQDQIRVSLTLAQSLPNTMTAAGDNALIYRTFSGTFALRSVTSTTE